MGSLQAGYSIALGSDEVFEKRVLAPFERFVFNGGTYDSSGRTLSIPTGVTVEIEPLYHDADVELVAILDVSDEPGLDQPDWTRWTEYQWRWQISSSKKTVIHIPAKALQTFTQGASLYETDRFRFPCALWVRAVNLPSNMLGPDNELGNGYAPDRVMFTAHASYGVRPDGWRPVAGSNGAITTGGQTWSNPTAAAFMADNWKTFVKRPHSFAVAVSTGQHTQDATMYPYVLRYGVNNLLREFPTNDKWPENIFHMTRDQAQAAFDDGRKVAVFLLYVLMPGEGVLADIIHRTNQLIVDDAPEMSTTNAASKSATNSEEIPLGTGFLFETSAKAFDQAATSITNDIGSALLDFGSEVLTFLIEAAPIALAMLKHGAVDGHEGYGDGPNTWEQVMHDKFPVMIQDAIDIEYRGDAQIALEEVLRSLLKARDTNLAITGNLTVPAFEFHSFRAQIADDDDGHGQISNDDYAEVLSSVEGAVRTLNIKLIASDEYPEYTCMVPTNNVSLSPDSAKQKATNLTGGYKHALTIPRRLTLPESEVEAVNVFLVADTQSGLASMFLDNGSRDCPLITRDAFPRMINGIQDGTYDLTALPFRDPAAASDWMYAMDLTGAVVGQFDITEGNLQTGTSFNWHTFLGSLGDIGSTSEPAGDLVMGLFSSRIHGRVAPIELGDITLGNTPDPTFRNFHHQLLLGTNFVPGEGAWAQPSGLDFRTFSDPLYGANTGYVFRCTAQVTKSIQARAHHIFASKVARHQDHPVFLRHAIHQTDGSTRMRITAAKHRATSAQRSLRSPSLQPLKCQAASSSIRTPTKNAKPTRAKPTGPSKGKGRSKRR